MWAALWGSAFSCPVLRPKRAKTAAPHNAPRRFDWPFLVPFEVPTLPEGFERPRNIATAWLTKNHFGCDVLTPDESTEKVRIEATFTALPDIDAVTKAEFLAGERVELYVFDHAAARFRTTGLVVRTDEYGSAVFEVPPDVFPKSAATPVRLVLLADNSVCPVGVWRLPAGVEIACFDMDGTLTLRDEEIERQEHLRLSGEQYVPSAYDGSPETTHFWFDSGYLVVYLSRRSTMEKPLSEAWLVGEGFAQGPVVHATLLEKCTGASKWKGLQARRWVTVCGADIAAMYCNAETDEEAWMAAGISSSRCFITEETDYRYATPIKTYPSHLRRIAAITRPAALRAPRFVAPPPDAVAAEAAL